MLGIELYTRLYSFSFMIAYTCDIYPPPKVQYWIFLRCKISVCYSDKVMRSCWIAFSIQLPHVFPLFQTFSNCEENILREKRNGRISYLAFAATLISQYAVSLFEKAEQWRYRKWNTICTQMRHLSNQFHCSSAPYICQINVTTFFYIFLCSHKL